MPAGWGRFPLGVSFERAKETKTRLGRSPLRTSLGYEAGTASILWPALALVGSHRWPGKSMERISFSVRQCPCFQGLTPVCGVSAAGNQAPVSWKQRLTRVRPWQKKYQLPKEQAYSIECPCYLCDPARPRAETRRTQGLPVPRGGFHKAGEGPAFGDSFPDFSSGRNRAQRSVPGWGAGFHLRNRRRAKLFFLPLKKPGAYAPGLVLLIWMLPTLLTPPSTPAGPAPAPCWACPACPTPAGADKGCG